MTAEVAQEGLKGRFADADKLCEEGRLDEAEALCRQLVDENPESAQAHHRLGKVMERLQQPEEAERLYREAFRLQKHAPDINHSLAMLLSRQQRWPDAEYHFRVALAEQPEFYDACLNLGVLLQDVHRGIEARYCFQRAIALRPEQALSYQRLGDALKNDDRTSEGLAMLERAVELDPALSSAWNALGGCHLRMTQIDQALAGYRRAAATNPRFLSAFKNAALASNYKNFPKEEVFATHEEIGKAVLRVCEGKALPLGFSQSLEPTRRLKIGFVSGDFRFHSVSYFLFDVLKKLDHHAFEFHAYSTSPTEDARTTEFKALFHHWHKVSALDFHQTAKMIRAHGMDILIDLSGNTANGRTETFALRPAPIQLTWIGYPNTTGVPGIDYRLVDAWTDPDGEDDAFYTERRLRLPGCFLSYTPLQNAPAVSPAPFMEQGHITFGSFNQRTKLSEECIRLWARILSAVPGSRLLLKSVLGFSEGVFRDAVLDQFEKYGVERERLTLLTSDNHVLSHLDRYAEIDIALDTLPYNGTTTTCEALWMGVPVVTCVGDRHASRVGLSLLQNANLSELIGQNEDEFVHIAVTLAGDRERLANLRLNMRERLRGSRLLDSGAMARSLEVLWRDLWRRHCDTAPAPVIDDAASSESVELLRLNIGGTERREGWTVLDIDEREEVDVVCSVHGLSRYEDASCAEIYCSHVLQCLPIADVMVVLQELHRILVPGGALYLAVPDLDTLAELFVREDIAGQQKFELMRLMFGKQETEHDFHKVGLTYDFLANCAGDVGFSEIEHVESFGLFDDGSERRFDDILVSLNLVIKK